jgi:type IV pilus assembly protein PilW
MLKRRNPATQSAVQRGMSLVELMVGVAVGLLIVAGSTTVVATQLADSRRLVVEAQIQQDLRSSSDVIVRELRRAGGWDRAFQGVWAPNAAMAVNPYDAVTLPSSSEVTIAWAGANTLGFRLRTSTAGVLELKDANGSWQALTDAATLNVTTFTVAMATLSSTPMACPANCPGGGQACWPTVQVRALQMQITGRAVSDASVVRSIFSSVRMRNDRIVNNYLPGSTTLCPS